MTVRRTCSSLICARNIISTVHKQKPSHYLPAAACVRGEAVHDAAVSGGLSRVLALNALVRDNMQQAMSCATHLAYGGAGLRHPVQLRKSKHAARVRRQADFREMQQQLAAAAAPSLLALQVGMFAVLPANAAQTVG